MSTTIEQPRTAPTPPERRGAGSEGRTRPAWQIVAQRELLVKLRDRNFLISLGLTLALIILSFGLQVWLAGKEEVTKVAVAPTSVGTVSAQSVAEKAGKVAHEDSDKNTFRVQKVGSDDAVRQAVRTGKADVGLVRQGTGWQLVAKSDPDDDVLKYVSAAASSAAMTANAAKQHVDLAKLGAGASVHPQALEPGKGGSGLTQIVSLVFAFLFYLAAMLFGMPIAQSVVEEKQSRIVEILASAVPLRQMLVGKVLGNTIIAICQVVLIVIVGLIGLSMTDLAVDVGAMASASGWFVVFFLAGFLVVACLFAVAGALASRSEDVQSTAAPVTTIVLVVFMAGFMLKGTALKIASFFPIVSVVAMPTRLAAGEASWWEPIVALVVALAVAAIIVRVATRLYTRSVMQTGGRLSYRQAFALRD